jgi:soluble P-type ATPase
MFTLDIPGYNRLVLEHFVSDYSGTLAEDGILLPGVREKLNELSKIMHIHIVTSDTFGKAKNELAGVSCRLHMLEGPDHTRQKEEYIVNLGAGGVVSLGNGNNDVRMLRASRIGIAVCLKEGCSVEAMEAAQIAVRSPIDAIDLFLFPNRLIATLRK